LIESIRVTFVQPDGSAVTHALAPGQSVLERALACGVAGLRGECGGAIRCTTCMCDVDRAWLARLPVQDPDEVELLGYVDEANETSRLTCQLAVTEALDGLVLHVRVRMPRGA
jgi:2Fe-2S ferredoxin